MKVKVEGQKGNTTKKVKVKVEGQKGNKTISIRSQNGTTPSQLDLDIDWGELFVIALTFI